MKEVQEKINDILLEKQTKILPANIRKGVNILGVDGTAEVPTPIYATTDYYSNLVDVLPDDTKPYVVSHARFDKYVIIRWVNSLTASYYNRNYTKAYLYEIQDDNSLKLLTTLGSSGKYSYTECKIYAISDNKLYIWSYSFPGGSRPHYIPTYIYHLDTGELESLRNINISYDFYEGSVILGNGLWLDTDSSCLYKFDAETEKVSRVISEIQGQYIGNNKTVYAYYGGTEGNYNSYIYSFTENSVVKSALLHDDNSSVTYNGLSYNGDRVFAKGNCYSTDESLTLGTLLKENVCGSDSLIYTVNDKYYVVDGTSLCTFDEDTNTFTEVVSAESLSYKDRYVFGLNQNSKQLVLFSFGNSDEVIAFIYNNTKYPINNDSYLTAGYLLLGSSAYTYNGEKITGTMPNNGELNFTPSAQEQTIPKGYTSGGKVAAVDYSNTLSPEEYQQALNTANEIKGGNA